MCATHDAKSKPWTKNTAVTAARAPRAFGWTEEPRGPGSLAASCAPYVDTGTSQLLDSLFVGLAVSNQDIDHSDIADVAESHPADLGGVSDCDDSTRGPAAARFTTASAKWWAVTPAVTSNPQRLMT